MRLPTRLLRRNPDTHKGDFGHVLVIAGSARFSGAALLCAEAALRSGAGLVTLGIPESLNSAVIKVKAKEVMTLPLPESTEGSLSLSALRKVRDFSKEIDVLAIGPGLGKNKSTKALVRKIIRTVNRAIVIDADALNALAGDLDLLTAIGHKLSAILTPHPAEMARLSGEGVEKIQSDRKHIASRFAKKHGVTLVLKGHNTVVADYKGKVYINKTGNPGMATAGSGDVLTGMIAAFLGQKLNSFEAAKYAVYLHGLAGDLAAAEKTQLSLIASDIIDYIPKAVKISS